MAEGMKTDEFGFNCGNFQMRTSDDGYLVPYGAAKPLFKSYVPTIGIADASGAFTFHATHAARIVCHLPVEVVWVSHRDEKEPFIALRTSALNDLVVVLTPYIGKPLALTFTKRSE